MADIPTGRLRVRGGSPDQPSLWTRSFLLVCSINLLSQGSFAAVYPTFAVYLGTLTTDTSVVGLAFGVFTFATLSARPVTGWLLDRTGRQLVQAVSIAAIAAMTLLYAWITLVWIVLALLVLHGAAWGVSTTTTPTIAADVVPAERRDEGFGLFAVLPNVALMAMPPAALWVAEQYGFDVQFAGAAAVALLALVPVALLGETAKDGGAVTTDSPSFYIREAVPAAVLVGLAGVPFGAINAFVPLYASDVGLGNAGLFFTVMGGAIILSRLNLGRLPGSPRGLLAGSFGLQSAALATVALAPRAVVYRSLPLGLLAGAALFGAGFALVFPLLQSAAVTATDGENGAVTATLLVGLDAGIGVGAVAAGSLAELSGLPTVYLGSVSVTVTAAVAALLLVDLPE
jgi:predicted MFS family arabinose efflux permease